MGQGHANKLLFHPIHRRIRIHAKPNLSQRRTRPPMPLRTSHQREHRYPNKPYLPTHPRSALRMTHLARVTTKHRLERTTLGHTTKRRPARSSKHRPEHTTNLHLGRTIRHHLVSLITRRLGPLMRVVIDRDTIPVPQPAQLGRRPMIPIHTRNNIVHRLRVRARLRRLARLTSRTRLRLRGRIIIRRRLPTHITHNRMAVTATFPSRDMWGRNNSILNRLLHMRIRNTKRPLHSNTPKAITTLFPVSITTSMPIPALTTTPITTTRNTLRIPPLAPQGSRANLGLLQYQALDIPRPRRAMRLAIILPNNSSISREQTWVVELGYITKVLRRTRRLIKGKGRRRNSSRISVLGLPLTIPN